MSKTHLASPLPATSPLQHLPLDPCTSLITIDLGVDPIATYLDSYGHNGSLFRPHNNPLLTIERLCLNYRLVALEDLEHRHTHDLRTEQLVKLSKSLRQRVDSRELVLVPPFRTSSTCWRCGYWNKNGSTSRTFVCPQCGFTLDRHLLAAGNLYRLAIPQAYAAFIP